MRRKDGEDLAQRAEFEPEHLVEKDRAVHVGVGETVGARIEVLLVMVRLEAERVEIGVEMPARAVGADQHQGVDRIARGLLDLGGGKFDARGLGARLHLVADRPFDLVPIAVERGNEFAARRLRPVRPRPRRPAGALEHIGAIILQALEECLPLGVDRLGVVLVAGMEVLDIVGIAAIEEGRVGEGGVGILTGHARGPAGWVLADRRWREKPGQSSGGINNTLSMLQLRCNNKIELNLNSFIGRGACTVGESPAEWANAVSPARGNVFAGKAGRLDEMPPCARKAKGPLADASGPLIEEVRRRSVRPPPHL